MEDEYMLTKFNEIYKDVDLTDIVINVANKDEELLKKLIEGLSVVIFKVKGKGKQTTVKSIKGAIKSRKRDLIYTEIKVDLSNGDNIKGDFFDDTKNISISINGKLIFDLSVSKFNEDYLVDKMISEYRKHLENDWKIR